MSIRVNSALMVTVLLGMVILIVLRLFVISFPIAYGKSMEPTVQSGDLMIASKQFKEEDISRGNIIIFKTDKPYLYIKRVIGVPGDKVRIQDNTVYINGEELYEPYLETEEEDYRMQDMDELIVPKGKFFVMGDNRVVSKDSRNGLGLAELEKIEAKYVKTIFPSFLPSLKQDNN